MAKSAAIAEDPRLDDHATLREVIEALAPLEARAGSPGEHAGGPLDRRAPGRGRRAGRASRRSASATATPSSCLPLALASAATGVLAATGRAPAAGRDGRRRWPTAAIADDASNGPRLWRRVASREPTTWNVVGEAGDPDGDRTLVVLAHHDAAPTGIDLRPSAPALAGRDASRRRRPHRHVAAAVVAGGRPARCSSALGAATGRRRMAATGVALSLAAAALGADIARSPIVPGANDNLSAVAVARRPGRAAARAADRGLRVLLVSCGAEEVLQGGIYGFAARHFPALDRERTWMLTLDTVGSPELVMLEGEGPFVMEDYPDPRFPRPRRAGRRGARAGRSAAGCARATPPTRSSPAARATRRRC